MGGEGVGSEGVGGQVAESVVESFQSYELLWTLTLLQEAAEGTKPAL